MKKNKNCKDKSKKSRPGEKGVTLIEVLVVVAIISILSAVTWELMGGTKNEAQVENVCNSVAALINKTRSYALSGKMVNGTVPSSFTAVVDTNNLIIKAGDEDGNNMETYTYPNGVTCSGDIFLYTVPNGDGISGIISCSLGDATRIVEVTPYKAECKYDN